MMDDTFSCGCVWTEHGDTSAFTFCSKHAAAPAMCEALRPFAKLAEAINRRGYSDSSRIVSLAGTPFKKEHVLLGRDFFEALAAFESATGGQAELEWTAKHVISPPSDYPEEKE